MKTPHPTPDQIADRAYQIHVQSGCRHGHDLDDWLQAEYELLGKPVRILAAMEPPPPPASGKPRRRSVIAVVHSLLL